MNMEVPKPVSAGLILSYRCSAECLHCMYACSPNRSGDWISEEDLETILSQLAGKILPGPFGPESVGVSDGLHFTGGEPFLNYELLCKAVELANDLDIPSTFVETNCFWCTDDRGTRDKLMHLKDIGMKGIMISVNPFYLEYVPFERTERAIKIGLEVFGNSTMVYQVEYYRRFKAMGIKGKVPLEKYLRDFEPIRALLRNVEFFIMGRACYGLRESLQDLIGRHPAHSFLDEPCSPPFLRSWHNHVDNYGNYMPGFCGGISLGDCRKLDRLLADGIMIERHPILGFLATDDFRSLFQFSLNLGYEENSDGYFSKCHLCTDIRKHLIEKDDFKELQPLEFYRHLV